MKKTTIYFLLLLIGFSCQGGKDKQNKENKQTLKDTVKTFTLPNIPAILSTPEQRAEYLIEHYWDNFNFTDTAYIHLPEITEQAWVDYITIFDHAPVKKVNESIKNLLKKAEKEPKVFEYFTGLAEKYLYDPNSPMRNEEFYRPVLEYIVTSSSLPAEEKIRPKDRLEMANKNRIGEKAANFTYTTVSGEKKSLYDISAEYTLIYFNNPGCSACLEVLNEIKNASLITQLVAGKRLKIIAIYPDKDLEEWNKHLNDIPIEWTNGYDHTLKLMDERLYDLKAIPTLYLLDKDKKVVLKDTTVPQMLFYFNQQQIR